MISMHANPTQCRPLLQSQRLNAHLYHGGISANYLVHVTENSPPSLQFFGLQMSLEEPRIKLIANWTPTVENILEDPLLLIGARVCGHPELVAEL